jgi:hypothetical protein
VEPGVLDRVVRSVLEAGDRLAQAELAEMTVPELEAALSEPAVRGALEAVARSFFEQVCALEAAAVPRERCPRCLRVDSMTSEERAKRMHDLLTRAGWRRVDDTEGSSA